MMGIEKPVSSEEQGAESSITNDVSFNAEGREPTSSRRLMISKMELINFKSYANTVTIGPFHKNFTSVVGPNGSGKSNVIDALLFIFGFRAKIIRQGKVSDLIHSSDKHPNFDFCQVNVFFQEIIDLESEDENGNEYEVIPRTEFVVSRHATRKNASSYLIDGKKKTKDEVVTRLKKLGIDITNNRFLILQGEVEQIAMMKPKGKTEDDRGLLEFLEEIIGSEIYREKIADAEKNLEAKNEEKDQKLARVKMIQGERSGMEKSVGETIAYIKAHNELAFLNCQIYQKFKFQCDLEKDAAEEQQKEHQVKLTEIQDGIKVTTSHQKELEKAKKKITKECAECHKAVQDAKDEFAGFERMVAQNKENTKQCEKDEKKFRKNIKAEENNIIKFKNDMETDNENILKFHEDKERDAENLVIEEEKLETIKAGLQAATASLTSELEVKEAELRPFALEQSEIQTALDIDQSEYNMIDDKYKKVADKLEESQKSLITLSETEQQRKVEIKTSEERLETIALEKPQKEEVREAIKTELTNYHEAIKKANVELQEANSAANSSQRSNKVIDGLMHEKEKGNIPGIYGRLGNLGKISDEYDVAITTCCPGLNNIVVDNTETAQRCAQYLRETNIGRATFIILDKLDERVIAGAEKEIQTPENVPRLYDLVKARKEIFRPAFYHSLRDTLVATDLEQATRVSNIGGRRRVVTLNGEVVDASGTLSGGGSKPSRGGMSANFADDIMSPEDIRKLEKKIHKNTQKMEKLRDLLTDAEQQIKALSEEETQLKMNIKKYVMDIEAFKKQLIETEATIVELKKIEPTQEDEDRKEALKKKISVTRAAFRKVSPKCEALGEEIRVLKQKISDVGGAKLKAQKNKVQNLANSLSAAGSNITKAQVSIKAAQKKIEAAEKKLASLKIKEQENEEKFAKLRDQQDNSDEVAQKSIEDINAVIAIHDKKKQELSEIDVQVSEIDVSLQDLKSKEVDVKELNSKYLSKIKEAKQKIKHWESSLAGLEMRPLPEWVQDEDSDVIKSFILQKYTDEELEAMDKEALEYKTTILDERVKHMNPNLKALEEYRRKTEDFERKRDEHDEATKNRDDARNELAVLKKERLDMFMEGFSIITLKLKEMYQMITLGGDAELEQVNSLDPFEDGIVFSVRPPKKSWKNISNLSGGEKTLSSLALVFALHHYKPTPLYVMDEIDAALDFKNVSIVANYIKERTKNAQFIIISLRNNMFELANRLVGIYKTEDHTKTVAIDPHAISIQNAPQAAAN